MWLRDLLPQTVPFANSRIMTFGYNSKWADKKCLSGLQEWSNDLLDRVCSVRTTAQVRMPCNTSTKRISTDYLH
jgi:hypothetical protein